ncbi:protein SOB FIVE-LIKE 5-like [Lycium barbarum]|uniref:protein SOB FIVE-LIKE 5-like n=1 Tax=Lycium ferocissimum TaxID=112874 RepID=UPI0028163A70|nr:protein SOB FIVE-LIKE 5-like [Lycium ferocissimum]XP_060173367.1 protein SOB FIVE-LIKE 5-like [Lycium barbarum]
MDISGSECTSECESGWTMYFDEFSYSSDQFNGVKGRSVCEIDEYRGKSTYVVEDLSMVSDASSGPPHNFHEDKEYNYEENGYMFYPSVTENTKAKQRRNMNEQSGKEQNLYLDDTASSPVSDFQKDTTGFYNDTTYMEQVAGYSGTYSKGKSVLGKHFGFLKTSVDGKSSSEKSGVLKGRKRG